MNIKKIPLFALRISLGWIFLYSGITKVLDPTWSAAGLLTHSALLPSFFQWLSTPGILPIVNGLNAWGQLLLGISLVLGIAIQRSTPLGITLMVLYYIPQLTFPFIGHSYLLVDEHVVFALGLMLIMQAHTGIAWGLDGWLAKKLDTTKYKTLRMIIGI